MSDLDESADPTLRRRPELLNDLHEVAERGELYVHYQPVVKLSSGEVTSIEALAHWEHPRFGSVCPDEFIPLAEESGTIVPIGRWVIAQAVADCARWRREGSAGVGVAINRSGRQLSDKGLSAPRISSVRLSSVTMTDSVISKVTASGRRATSWVVRDPSRQTTQTKTDRDHRSGAIRRGWVPCEVARRGDVVGRGLMRALVDTKERPPRDSYAGRV